MKKWILLVLLSLGVQICMAQSVASDSRDSSEAQTRTTLNIKVFPNPATNVVNILGLKNTPKADITITDAYGHRVLVHQWAITKNALNLPVSTLDSGTYMVLIRSEAEQVKTKFYKR